MITVYILTYNEELLLPFTIAFYRKRFPDCKIVVYDNCSTDNTVIFAERLGATVVPFHTNDMISDTAYKHIKNRCWMSATTSWALVCDVDELLDISQEQLLAEDQAGTTLVRAKGYNMVSMSNEIDLPGITYGYRNKDVSDFYDKTLLFKRDEIKGINYAIGAHAARPSGRIQYNTHSYPLYHYKYITPDHLVARYAMYRDRLSPENRKMGWGGGYNTPETTLRNQFEEFRLISKQIIL